MADDVNLVSFAYKYHKAVSVLQSAMLDELPMPTYLRVTVLFGAAGSGKSYAARHLAEQANPGSVCEMGEKGMEGYRGQRSCIYEEFNGARLTLRDFKDCSTTTRIKEEATSNTEVLCSRLLTCSSLQCSTLDLVPERKC